MTFKLLAGALLLAQGLAGALLAAEATVREDHPSRYEVVRGDTLWGIAGIFLEQPWRWPEVWEVNPEIDNPHLIYPGDIIRLRYEDGEPVLSLERGGSSAPADLETRRLSPEVRREALRSPIPAIPHEAVAAFLEDKRVLSREELDKQAYYLGNRKGLLLAAAGDVIFARGDWREGSDNYEILRPGRSFTAPGGKEVVGTEATRVGRARLLERDGDKGTLRIEESLREIRQGDLLAPRASNSIEATFFPETPSFELKAALLDLGDGLVYGGQYDTVVLHAGEQQRLKPGHLLSLQRPAQVVRDERSGGSLEFPGETFGTVLVYRVFERTSLGLILNSNGPVRIDDVLVTP